MPSPTVDILDTTLRDGSYTIDFQFTAEDTSLIASCLEWAGIPFIEMGHGLGLGAARAGKGDQAATDEAYLNAAASAVTTAKFGPFFIPGIGTKDDIDLAVNCGAHFIRIGTDVTEVEQALPFIEYAKQQGLITFSNLMKSYTVTPEVFAKQVHHAAQAGADYVYLVDSAGGMLPDDVANYLNAAQEKSTVPLGFHGHNNLSMAVANSLRAIESGATIVDASLQGMGRSEGNAITEILAAILQKQGHCASLNVNALLDIAEAFIRPMLKHPGYSSIGVASGYTKFHSSFLAPVLQIAHAQGIDPRDLMLSVSNQNLSEASEQVLKELADTVSAQSTKAPIRFTIPSDEQISTSNFLEQSQSLAIKLKEQSKKQALPSVLNIAVTQHESQSVSPAIECSYGCAIANIMLTDTTSLASILSSVDGVIDYVLLDSGENDFPSPSLSTTHLLHYSDALLWTRATITHLTELLDGSLANKNIRVMGNSELAQPTTEALKRSGAQVVESFSDLNALVALSPRTPIIDTQIVEKLSPDTLVFDAGIGSIHPEALAQAEQSGIQVVRIDLRPSLAATALEAIHMHTIVHERMGRATWNGVDVVAGGVIGKLGDIIVDHIANPSRIIGVADGKGGIQSLDAKSESVQSVRRYIVKQQLKPKT